MTVKPSKFVMDYKPWSVSKIKVAQQCPRKFYRNYVVKEKVEKRESTAILVGYTVHSILEWMLKGQDWDQAYTKAVSKNNLTTSEVEKVNDLRLDILGFLDRFSKFRERNEIELWRIEQRMAVDINLRPVKFFDNDNAFLRGVLDLVMYPSKKPHALILDHKTGKVRSLADYREQFECYLILVKAHQMQLKGVKVGVHHLQAPSSESVVFTPLKDTTNIRPYWDWFIEYLNTATAEAHQFDKVQTGWWCRFCDYEIGCPAHKGSDSDKEEIEIQEARNHS